MENKIDFDSARLVEELDSAVLAGDIGRADELAGLLFRLQGGTEEETAMPDHFSEHIAARALTLQNSPKTGGWQMKSGRIKKAVTIAAAAALVMALGITALATHFFGISDLVMKDGGGGIVNPYPAPSAAEVAETPQPSPQDLIALQGYPDSSEYKAAQEWNAFLAGYDQDHAILNKVGNGSNAYTEKYPMYLVYSKDMADKLEEIAAKYGLKLHVSNLIAETPEALFSAAGVGSFIKNKDSAGVNKMYSGYVYNDGTFQYDGEAVLDTGVTIEYQLGDYVKGTFSDTYLNVGDASGYQEWLYTTKSGVQVSLALGQSKALLILDLPKSFVVVNVLGGTTADSTFGSDSIARGDLEKFADMFDFTQLK